jgi:hypothetical protein
VVPTGKRHDVDHRVEVELAVQMREAVAVGGLVAQRRSQALRVHAQEHEIGDLRVRGIGDRHDLVGIREMDEPLAGE